MRKPIKVNDEIELRYWETKWAAALFALTEKNRKYLQPWLHWVQKTKDVGDSKNFILKCQKEYEKGDALELGIWIKDELVGCIGLHKINKVSRNTAIGYWLSSDYYGRGIVTKSVRALVNYAFGELKLHRIEIVTGTDNTKSYTIAKKLGFIKEGVKRDIEFIDNRFVDYVIYSVLEDEWKG